MRTSDIPTNKISLAEMADKELDMTLECVAKIRKHLKRHIKEDGKLKYVNNLVELSSMFGSDKCALLHSIAV